MTRAGAHETAFVHRDSNYIFEIVVAWDDRAGSEKHIRCAREFWTAMQPFSTGAVYLNYLTREGEEWWTAPWKCSRSTTDSGDVMPAP